MTDEETILIGGGQKHEFGSRFQNPAAEGAQMRHQLPKNMEIDHPDGGDEGDPPPFF